MDIPGAYPVEMENLAEALAAKTLPGVFAARRAFYIKYRVWGLHCPGCQQNFS